jgi:hypothetical protein
MKRIIALAFLSLLTVFSFYESGAVQAQNDVQGLEGNQGIEGKQGLEGNPIEVNDGTVQNLQGEVLGKVSHVVMDSISGRAVYVLIQDNERLYPVPADLLAVQAETGKMIIDIDKEKFISSPSFTADTVPDLNDTEYGSRIHRFYGVSPFWEREQEPGQESQPSPEGSPELPPSHPSLPEMPEGHPPIN